MRILTLRLHLPLVALLAAMTGATFAPPGALMPDAPVAAIPNDNRSSAGRLHGDTLTSLLDLVEAAWRPGGSVGPPIAVFAFAESGQAPRIPGPLLRVRAGTVMHLTVRNRLDREAAVHGLNDHDGHADSVVLAAGESRTIAFRATTPGTHFYWGRTTKNTRVFGRFQESQLVGAFIVDSAAAGPRPRERVMVISAYDDTVRATGFPDDHFQVFAINGLSWPHTEPLTMTQGDTVTWRVINASDHSHPMHLHGFFFTVESRGTALQDTIYARADHRAAVTEELLTATTTSLTWIASRPGNWLFHCHMINHIDARLRLEGTSSAAGHGMSHARVEDVMSGLVLALRVIPNNGAARASKGGAAAQPDRGYGRAASRQLHLFVTEAQRGSGASPVLSYVLQQGVARPAADSMLRPGSTLVLHQGEPTEIVVTNLSSRPTAVHWHGLELESFFDGVAGWSGADGRTAPLIAPGDSFTVHLTPPRAGTFIYHTHADEDTQLRGGLFGAFIVLPSGAAQRDTTERLLLITNDGAEPQEFASGLRRAGEPLSLRAGVAHRLRLVSIGINATFRVRLLKDSTVTHWRPLAKDGADLPAPQAIERTAQTIMGAGETLDVELRRPEAENLTLELRKDGVVYYRVPVVVR